MPDQKLWEKWLPNHNRVGDEKIILFIRRHGFTLFIQYLFVLLLFLAPIFVYWIVRIGFDGFLTGEVGRAVVIMTGSIYYLFWWTACFTVFIDYYLDIWIVTNHRIIDIEQKGLFNQLISEQTLEKVQDTSSTIKGVFPTFLGYGDVLIQTAGAKNLFHFRQIPEPEVAAREINRLAQEYRDKHAQHDI